MKPQDVMVHRTPSRPPENPKVKPGACVPGQSGGGFKRSSQRVDVGDCDDRGPGRDRVAARAGRPAEPGPVERVDIAVASHRSASGTVAHGDRQPSGEIVHPDRAIGVAMPHNRRPVQTGATARSGVGSTSSATACASTPTGHRPPRSPSPWWFSTA